CKMKKLIYLLLISLTCNLNAYSQKFAYIDSVTYFDSTTFNFCQSIDSCCLSNAIIRYKTISKSS
ncbi:MAG: hypothetical protein ACJ0PT_01400, partial [Flavobacteriales bacterium]